MKSLIFGFLKIPRFGRIKQCLQTLTIRIAIRIVDGAARRNRSDCKYQFFATNIRWASDPDGAGDQVGGESQYDACHDISKAGSACNCKLYA